MPKVRRRYRYESPQLKPGAWWALLAIVALSGCIAVELLKIAFPKIIAVLAWFL